MMIENTAVALGFFDGLHLGHIEVIKSAILKDEYTPSVFTFNDKSLLPKMQKQENIITFKQKLKLLEAIGVKIIFAPDFIETKDLSPQEFVEKILIKKLNAKFVTCGYDFRFGKNGKSGPGELKKICSEHNIAVKKIPAVLMDGKAISSTQIREYIKNGDISEANRLLGYELMYDLPVVHGRKLGRNLLIPTINQSFPKGNLLPRPGVYKSWIELDGFQYRSITNIGYKPTVGLVSTDGLGNTPVIETHILGFREEIEVYGQSLTVALVDFIREERKFNSIEELKNQIEQDVLNCKNS